MAQPAQRSLAPTDPDVRIPPAVKAAAQRAEEIFHAAQGTQPDNPETTPDEPGDNGEQNRDKGQKKTSEAQAPQDTPQAPAPPPAKPAATGQDTPRGNEQPVDWEQRYNSMKGRYDRAERDLRDLSGQVSQLQGLLATMNAPAPAAQPPAAPPELQAKFLITPEEESEYGAEFLKVVEKKAGQIASELTRDLQAKVDRLEGQLGRVGGHIAGDAKARMHTHLDENVTNWRELNNDENFLRWLRLPDTYSGAIRHDLLKAAYDRNDAHRVAAFFNGFLAEEAAVDPATRGQETGAPAKPNGAGRPRVPLDKLAAPGRAKTGAGSGAPSEKPIITRAEVTQFYKDVAAGKYRGNESEKDLMERQLFEAQRDGRIR